MSTLSDDMAEMGELVAFKAAQIVALEAEVATLKRKLDDAAQLIKMRTADCADLWAERDESLKEVLANALLKAEVADLRAEAQTSRELMYDAQRQGVEKSEQYIAERKAHEATMAERDAAMKLVELRTTDLGSVAAERDRLKTALEWIAGLSRVGLNIGAAIQEAERALASNPSTEEGG